MNVHAIPAVLVVAGLLLGALRLRRRLAALATLPTTVPSGTHGVPAGAVDGRYRLVTAEGVVVDAGTRRSAARYAEAAGLDALDLVPADIPVVQAYALARLVDPAAFRRDRLARGRGAGHALLVTVDLLDRAGVGTTENLDAAAFIRLTDRLKKYAPTGIDLVVAEDLRARPVHPATVRARLRALGAVTPVAMTAPVLGAGLLAGTVVLWPTWGWVALAAYCLQPYLLLAGTPLRPGDRHRGAWLRPWYRARHWLGAVRGDWRSSHDRDRAERLARARVDYAAELARGVDRFFEPPRDSCPWCGDPRLRQVVDTPDRIQVKPGRFVLQECSGCRHVFQNPRLSSAGLDFYYRDAYDGLGEDSIDLIFGLQPQSYRGRAELVRRFTRPRRWLDVGTGYGHFCVYALDTFPDTIFDGIDMGASIEEAQRRGWVATGYRGLFPEYAEKLAGRYDVVSMHHYLEHTLDPRVELDAAALVVAAGGYLMIEVPDPRSRLGRLLRGYWIPWFQPEHLHFVPVANLLPELRRRGFDPVAVEHGAAHQSCDFAGATLLWLNSRFPDPDRAWASGPSSPGRRLVHGVVSVLAVPPVIVAIMVDQLLGVLIRRSEGGNCYRVLARRSGGGSA
ncbi:methyltransferase domain-containing protein [Micromonospora sp. URMC 105]|uniref:class I SAM-dependent methyltransferase n=1 Tax=Micromonospora sp. URMC 105 TaxID=3423413 RepID=UPI003F1D38AC